MKPQKLILILSVLLFCKLANAQLPNITDPRVHIKLPTVKGDSISLASLKGKVVLLDFWASWCKPCRKVNRQLVKLYAKYKQQGFEIYSVSLDEEKEAWQEAITEDKITWSQVNDATDHDAPARWNVTVVPTCYLINKKGDVVVVDPEVKDLEKTLKKLLTE